jgi:hypothetical protein
VKKSLRGPLVFSGGLKREGVGWGSGGGGEVRRVGGEEGREDGTEEGEEGGEGLRGTQGEEGESSFAPGMAWGALLDLERDIRRKNPVVPLCLTFSAGIASRESAEGEEEQS